MERYMLFLFAAGEFSCCCTKANHFRTKTNPNKGDWYLVLGTPNVKLNP